MPALKKRLNERDKKDVSTDSLAELAELVLKNNIFNFNEKTLKQKRGTSIGTKFALPYSILFMAELEEKILEEVDNNSHCNNLEKWLSERGYREKLVCKEILKARSQSRETLLDKEKMSRNDDRVTFNIAYYPVFKNIKIILEELHILLAPDEQHRKVFTDIPRIGFKNGKNLKDHLVRSVLPKIDIAVNSGPCGEKRLPCELCKLMKKTSTFKKRYSEAIHYIHKPLNCNSKNTVYLIECNQCWKQYIGSSTVKFRYRANNYKVFTVNLRTKSKFLKKL